MTRTVLIGIVLAAFCVHSEEDPATQNKNAELERKKFLEEEEAEREAFKARVPRLIEKLKTTKDGNKEFIIQNLAYSKDKRAIGPLAEVMLQSTVPEERAYAASKLSSFQDKQTIPAFKKALLDTIGARPSAAVALYHLGEIVIALPELESLALEGNTAALSCFRYFNEKGKPSFDKNAKTIYMKAIKYKNEDSRIHAALYLAEMSEKDIAFQVAAETLRNSKNDRNKDVAIYCMEKIGDEKAAVEISKFQDDPNLHNAIIQSLKTMKRKDLIKK